MSELFLTIFNMSVSASWLVLAVMLSRVLLKKMPKWIHVLLWGMVGVRLVCPFTIESALSLIPSAQTLPPEVITSPTPTIQTGFAGMNQTFNPIFTQTFAPAPEAELTPLQQLLPVLSAVWLAGAAILLAYLFVSFALLRYRVRTAVRLRENIFQSEFVSTPFLLGFIRPRIYLPFGMEQIKAEHVIAHEKAHLARRDHWWKPLGFVLLAVYWFNPLMWAAYILLCRDIELACDEKVIKTLSDNDRADYAETLVACSINRRAITACPLAFGEVGVKARVKSVMNYKKPAFWVILLALITCVVVAVCFLTNPETDGEEEETTPSDTEETPTPALKLGFYKGDTADTNGFLLSLSDDGSFFYLDEMPNNLHPDQSLLAYRTYGNGKYTLEEDILTLMDGELKLESRFRVEGDKLVFLKGEEKDFSYFNFEYGTVFSWSEASNQTSADDNPFALGNYTYYRFGSCYIALGETDRFLFCDDRIFRRPMKGSYKIEGDLLTLTSDNQNFVNVFRITEDGLVYNAADSTGFQTVSIQDGSIFAKFEYTAPESTAKTLDGRDVLVWFSDHGDQQTDLMVKEIPGVIFKYHNGQICMNAESAPIGFVGTVTSAYFVDMNGDGVPELCVKSGVGSGVYHEYISFYDIVDNKIYRTYSRTYGSSYQSGYYELIHQNGLFYFSSIIGENGNSMFGDFILTSDGTRQILAFRLTQICQLVTRNQGDYNGNGIVDYYTLTCEVTGEAPYTCRLYASQGGYYRGGGNLIRTFQSYETPEMKEKNGKLWITYTDENGGEKSFEVVYQDYQYTFSDQIGE